MTDSDESHEHSAPLALPWEPSWLPRLSINQWTLAIVFVGVVLRVVRFLLPFPLWCDEFQVADNLLDRGYSELLLPLRNNQVAPIGFLWSERLIVDLFGFHEWSLRLIPLVCSLASLFLLRSIARQLLSPVGQLLAVSVLAAAYYPIRLGSEIKPYAGDLFCALTILFFVVRWQTNRNQLSNLVWLAILIGPIVLFSFPAVFAGGAACVTIAFWLLRDAREQHAVNRKVVAAAACIPVVLCLAFAGVMWLNASQQYAATQDQMVACWSDSFPPLKSPVALLGWCADAATGVVFAYPVGSENGGSLATSILCSVGVIAAIRRRDRGWLTFAAGIFGLSLIAAAMQRYPFGGHNRLSQHLAPVVIIAMSAGGSAIIGAIRSRVGQVGAIRLILSGALLLAGGTMIRDINRPYKSKEDAVHDGFARWFWSSLNGGPLICLKHDLGETVYGPSHEAPYRVYRQLHHKRRLSPADAENLIYRGSEPFRCVAFHSESVPRDEIAYERWLDQVLCRYELLGTHRYQVDMADSGHPAAGYRRLCYDVLEFVPRRTTLPEESTRSLIVPVSNTVESSAESQQMR